MASHRPDFNRSRFYNRLHSIAKFRLFAAVFFIFAPIGLLLVSSFSSKRPWYATAVFFGFSGLQAVGWAYAFFASRYKILILVIAAQGLWLVLPRWFPVTSGPVMSISPEGIGSALAIAAGYAMFVVFIAREGTRTVRLEAEMSLARQIHDALIPPIVMTAGRLELFGRSVAGSDMGGDLLDIVVKGDRVGVYVADVSGHGVRAGVVMGMVKAAIRMKLQSSDDLGELLNDLNRVVCDLVTPGMFVTGAFLRFDGSSVEFSGAGHGPVLHFHATHEPLTQIESEHFPLGVDTTHEYTTRSFQLRPADTLLLVTDGLTEVLDTEGRPLGQGPIEEVFLANARQPLADLYDFVMGRVQGFGPQIDDQSLLFIRVR